jgi:hypothetical protein
VALAWPGPKRLPHPFFPNEFFLLSMAVSLDKTDTLANIKEKVNCCLSTTLAQKQNSNKTSASCKLSTKNTTNEGNGNDIVEKEWKGDEDGHRQSSIDNAGGGSLGDENDDDNFWRKMPVQASFASSLSLLE